MYYQDEPLALICDEVRVKMDEIEQESPCIMKFDTLRHVSMT